MILLKIVAKSKIDSTDISEVLSQYIFLIKMNKLIEN